MRYLYLCFVSCFLFVSFGLRSENIRFDYLDVAHGLSQNSVTAFAQDDLGRIWIGTRDGLNLYDGNSIEVFRQVKGNPNSLLGHFVHDIKIYDKTLWVVTKSGLSELNIQTLAFQTYPFEGAVATIRFNDRLFLGTKSGLFELERASKVFKQSSLLPTQNAVTVSGFNVDQEGTLWIATTRGLYAHFATGITVKVLNENSFVSFVDSRKNIWVGTAENGLFILNKDRKIERRIQYENRTTSLLSNIIRDIEEDAQGNIWVGTFKGLSVLNGQTYEITNFTSEDTGGNALSHNSIYAILRDRQDGMWIGTFFGGVSYYNRSLYHQYEVTTESDKGTSFGVIGKMIEDNKSNLWIATEGGGLNYLDRKTNCFTHFKPIQGKGGLSQGNIRSLYLKDNNTLLVGTHLDGLNVLDLKGGKAKVFMHDPNNSLSIPSNIVRDILPYKGIFLLATSNGVVKYNPVNDQFTPFFEMLSYQPIPGLINCLLEDSFGILWIGTEDYGLFAYNKKTGLLKRYTTSLSNPHSIGDNNISCLFEDHLFRLWIGTSGGGLNQYIRDKDRFESYNITTHKFPSNFILGIKSSNYGGLWLATSKGLTLFDVNKNEVYNYSQKNGFPIDELNQGALYLTNDGELFVGGIHGLVSFNEKAILDQKQVHTMIFERLSVNNKEVEPNDDTGILENAIAYTNEIILQPYHNVFTISYSACNYILSNKNTYRYKLEGFDTDWVDSADRTSITYTNLNPGIYVLTVQALSGFAGTVTGEKSITIEVLSPLYKRWYAMVLYVILAVLIFFWIKKMYRNKFVLENRIKSEQREKDQLIQLNQLKLDFFTNVSHEFRTPLTLIVSTLESILENPKTLKENQNKIIGTHNNVVRLNNLITELLDFRKLELGYRKLKVQEINLSEFLFNIYNSFSEYAHYHHIVFQYSGQLDMQLWFDRVQMEKVFYNLLSNAFKFVDDNQGKISIEVCEQPTHVDIRIIDNGIGISKDNAEQIFDPYYQIDNIEITPKAKGTGIGLALCKMIIAEHKGEIVVESGDQGTIFTLKILKGNSHYAVDDLYYEESDSDNSTLKVFSDLDAEMTSDENQDTIIDTQGATILLVEDNSAMRSLIKSIFHPYYKVIEAADGEEGIRKAIDAQPDIVISDVMMPKVSGTQLCAMLKRNIRTSHIPVLLLTAKATDEFKIEGLEVGADGYMAKPFSNRLLRAKVKNIISNRMLLHEKFKNDPTVQLSEMATNSIDEKFLKQAQAIVEKHLDDSTFLTQDLAQEMGIGRSKLFDKIKGISGLTPNDYILKIRLTKASEILLKNPENLTISEIAYSVGFSTSSYFSKCFKHYYGITPTEYLNQKNKKE